MSNKNDKLSVFISLILRHKPEVINIKLDKFGYADVNELIQGINESGRKINFDILEDVVKSDKKCRYSFNSDKFKIRANQGHSINVNVELKECKPPKFLYHGTATRFMDSIKNNGLKKMSRLYVHLSDNIDTALQVGKRHGQPIILKIDSEEMYKERYRFFLSENGVWLTEYVPSLFISIQ